MLILILVFLSLVHEYAYFYEYIWKSVYSYYTSLLHRCYYFPLSLSLYRDWAADKQVKLEKKHNN